MSKETPNWENKKILIVEDNENSNLFFKYALQLTKIQIVFIESGNKAVEYVIQDTDNEIDLVLMDINLPSQNGLITTIEIKEHRPQLPIVIQTAYINQYMENHAFAAGCDAYISKPIRLPILYNTIAKFLDK